MFDLKQLVVQRASIDDAELIYSMQIEAFKPLLTKYRDFETSPANESLDRTIDRLNQKQTNYYLILFELLPVGAIRIVKKESRRYKISPIFVLPEFQGKGIAKATMQTVEKMYSDSLVWELDTILEEPKLCGLYESLGYIATGKTTKINDRMTAISYEKKTKSKY